MGREGLDHNDKGGRRVGEGLDHNDKGGRRVGGRWLL